VVAEEQEDSAAPHLEVPVILGHLPPTLTLAEAEVRLVEVEVVLVVQVVVVQVVVVQTIWV
jgi:hypothetical protein